MAELGLCGRVACLGPRGGQVVALPLVDALRKEVAHLEGRKEEEAGALPAVSAPLLSLLRLFALLAAKPAPKAAPKTTTRPVIRAPVSMSAESGGDAVATWLSSERTVQPASIGCVDTT